MSRRRIVLVAAAGAALGALGLLVSGCGGPGAAASATTAATTSTTAGGGTSTGRGPADRAALQAFQACLKAHGVKTGSVPFGRRPGGRPPTGTNRQAPPARTSTTARRPGGFRARSPKLQKAFRACGGKLPNGFRNGHFGGRGSGGPGRPGTSTDANPAFAKYTKCLAQHGVEFGAASATPATFRKAQAACRTLLPAQRGAANG